MKFSTVLTLFLLGLLFKAYSKGNSTKVYYAALQIERDAYDKFNGLLINMQNMTIADSILKFMTITTDCDLDHGSCNCTVNNTWSDAVCQEHSCCNQQNCTFNPPNATAMCVPVNRVFINGSLTVNASYSLEYFDWENIQYQNHRTNYTQQLESCFSSLEWFDSLNVTGFSQGSVIVNFVMNIMGPVDVTALENIVTGAEVTLKGTFNIVTTGLIKSYKNQSQEKIPYGSSVSITCQPPEALGKCNWTFQQNGKQKVDITNGTEATVVPGSINSTVFITSASEVWKGTFICDYNSKNSTSITHRGILLLNVALIPQITIISDPPCPSCKGAVLPVHVTVLCIISNSTENYAITWNSTISYKQEGTKIQNNQISYEATANIFCDKRSENIYVTCEFKNSLNQIQNATINIPIIYDNSPVCKQDGDWKEVIVNFTATMLCGIDTVGVQTRKCSQSNGETAWETAIVRCVNTDLQSLLHDAQNLQRGQGIVEMNANDIFTRLRQSTEKPTFSTFANINASVAVMGTMTNASSIQKSKWDSSIFPQLVKGSSNLLNESLKDYWHYNGSKILAINYLKSFEEVIHQSNINVSAMEILHFQEENVQIVLCNNQTVPNNPCYTAFNTSIIETSNTVIQTGMKNLNYNLPSNFNNGNVIVNNIIISVIPVNGNKSTMKMSFSVRRPRNHKMYCVYLNNNTSQWSDTNCIWGGANNPGFCDCAHNSAFTILMAVVPINITYASDLTYIGLGFSISSLTLCLIIECLVWNTVVKSDISHFRHTVLVNIMLCLLIAHCCLLVVSFTSTTKQWCLVLTVMQHFCFLAMFFWTLCMSMGLLHQLIFVFVNLRKKVYLGLSFSLGYVCPLIIVTVTIISYDNGAADLYYDPKLCWLMYSAPLQGSIHAFVIPVGIIVIVNMFTMVVVISRILKPTVSEGKTHDEKEVARSIIKTVVFLTPALGITWALGLFVLVIDFTSTPFAQIVNYGFILFNSFQGFFIFLTGCLGEKRVRDALLNRFKQQKNAQYKSESSTRITSATKKK